MRQRQFLFVGGPLHAQVLPVDEVVAVNVNMTDDVTGTPEGDDIYPDVVTNLQHATHYTKRAVLHRSNDTGRIYKLSVFVWEQIGAPTEAQMLLGDAVMHQYFLTRGTEVAETVRPASRIIVPGR